MFLFRLDENPLDEEDESWEDIDDTCLLCEKPLEASKTCVMKKQASDTLI